MYGRTVKGEEMNWWVYFVFGILECLSLECVFIGLWSSYKIRKEKEMIGHTSFGYDEGFNAGYKKGRADCLREAHKFADQESYKEGYKRGLEQGRADTIDEVKEKLNNTGAEITFNLPVEEILGEDIDLDDFAMLVQDAVQVYRKMVLGVLEQLKEQK